MRYDPIIPVEQSHEPPGSPNNGRYNGNGEDDLLIEERLSGAPLCIQCVVVW